ncbi:MAG: hypothetical protein HZC36_04435 [Armatimonadetes bacterium]|nr:hypothetical protein [Armatimonadota bacterium]
MSKRVRKHACVGAWSLAALALGQQNIKPLRMEGTDAGKLNNEGIELSLKGKFREAVTKIDLASVNDLTSPIPWINGSWLQLELGRHAAAFTAIRQAQLMGDASLRRLTLDIEVETARGQLDKAWSGVRQAEFQRPEEPYVHMARAKWADSASRSRVAERSRWQAYRFGREVVVDSKPFSTSDLQGDLGPKGAGVVEGNVQSFGGSGAVAASGKWVSETLGGQVEAKNTAVQAQLSADGALGTLYGNYRTLDSERPGPPNTLFVSTPGAALRYEDWMLGWQRRFGDFTLNLNRREAIADLRPAAGSLFVPNIEQRQWMAEGRWDRGPWTLGGGTSVVDRWSVLSPAIEPFEDVFPKGSTRISHGYFVYRADLSQRSRLILGGTVEEIGGHTHGLLSGELALKISGEKYFRIGTKPTMNRAGTVLYPEDLRARPLGDNTIDRVLNSALTVNRTTSVFSAFEKQDEVFANLDLIASEGKSLRIGGFRKQFSSGLFMTGDPQQQASLDLFPMAQGRVQGVEATYAHTVSSKVELGAYFVAQESEGTIGTGGGGFRTRLSNTSDRLGGITLDFAAGSTSIAVFWSYMGPQTQYSYRLNEATMTKELHLERVGSLSSVNVVVKTPLKRGSLEFAALNLTGSSFYKGYGASPYFAVGYSSRF